MLTKKSLISIKRAQFQQTFTELEKELNKELIKPWVQKKPEQEQPFKPKHPAIKRILSTFAARSPSYQKDRKF